MEEVIVGVVGELQFEVLDYRLKNEYNVEVIMEPLTYEFARWLADQSIDPKTLDLTSDTRRVQDMRGNKLLLFSGEWNIAWAQQHNSGLELLDFSKG